MHPRLSVAAILVTGCAGVLLERAHGQDRDSLAGESAAQALKRSIAAEAERYNIRYGPVRFKASGTLAVSYTDNVFYSSTRSEDVLINPEITLDAFWPVTELNALRLSLGLGYEWYLKNSGLNPDLPLINPGTELNFRIFVGDVRIQLHERFFYQESLFFNSFSEEGERFYNFNDVGTFSRFDNQVGFNLDWDLNEVVLSAGYNHEDFVSTTSQFEYLNRASEWFTATASFSLGDKAKTGLEASATLHDYETDTTNRMSQSTLNDNWRGRIGPFLELNPENKISLRAGAGFDTGQYDDDAFSGSDYDTYYLYGRVRQETRLFSHSLAAGHEHVLGDIANNRRTTYARYSISSPIVENVELGGNLSVNFAKEFGGEFEEEFTYYGAGLRIGWLFHKFWRADLGYEFRLKDSEQRARDFHRNRVTLSATYSF